MNIRLPLICLQLEQNASVFGFNGVIHPPSVVARRLGQRAGMSPERQDHACKNCRAAYTPVNGRSIVRRQFRRSLRGFVVCAAAGLVLAGVAGADNQTSFQDPAGDAGSSFDITSLIVSSSPGLGFVTMVKRNPYWCWAGDLPL